MHPLLQKLTGTDRRSIGKSNAVVAEVLSAPQLFGILFNGMLNDDPVLRMRCADAVEKVSAIHPEYLQPYKKKLIQQIAKIEQQEVRWHVAPLFSRIALTAKERHVAVEILAEYLKDKSKIVKTFSMQALANIATQDETLRRPLIEQLEKLTRTGSPAMQARGKKLLTELKGK